MRQAGSLPAAPPGPASRDPSVGRWWPPAMHMLVGALLSLACCAGHAALPDGHSLAAQDPDWHIPLPAVGPEGGPGDPAGRDFLVMKDALARYLAIEQAGGWSPLPPGPPLRVGMRDPRVEQLRNRLRIGGDYDSEMGADPWFFDWGLDQAVRRLQRRHLLPENGVFDDAALAAANLPVEALIGQLMVAMERWRWLPREFGRRFVWVNIPAARLDVIEDGASVLTMRVVVGHRNRPTPSVAGELGRVVFNPAWSVPASIAMADLLPRQQQDSGYLSRHRVRVFRGSGNEAREVDPAGIDWSGIGPGRFPYRLVQDPGPGNSLGRIKIAFDNPFDIFLHDTPAKGLFELTTRTLSSGCVRLEDAPALATLLMAGDRPWSERDTAAAMDAGATRTINLRHPLPVYIVYLTVWADGDGELRFGRDIYGRDAGVRAALERSGGPAVAAE